MRIYFEEMRAERFQAHMFREIRRLRERFFTLGALKWLVSVVHPLMDRKSSHDGKPLPTSRVVTLVRFWELSIIGSPSLGEVRTLLCMPSHMLL